MQSQPKYSANSHKFEYGPLVKWLNYMLAPVGGTGMAAFGTYVFWSRQDYWPLSLVCFAIAGGLAGFGLLSIIRHRPITVDESQVSSTVLGWELLRLNWTEVTKIERRRYSDPQDHRPRHKFSIFSPTREIYFDDQIENLSELLDLLNAFATKYHIALFSVDAGLDTKRRIRQTVSDRNIRRRLLREGSRESIQSL
jgi:hypothetical protein